MIVFLVHERDRLWVALETCVVKPQAKVLLAFGVPRCVCIRDAGRPDREAGFKSMRAIGTGNKPPHFAAPNFGFVNGFPELIGFLLLAPDA